MSIGTSGLLVPTTFDLDPENADLWEVNSDTADNVISIFVTNLSGRNRTD